ncbi:hypothetical protein SDC9_183035 [bioreactor metagenome]|uniref:Uncharacterized protein n=1 Tax=bioreactor metagenome TaxID=1076179 RepID=A0A645H935_9ZZZZ
MNVEETRQQQRAFEVDDLVRRFRRPRGLFGGEQRRDPPVFHRERAVFREESRRNRSCVYKVLLHNRMSPIMAISESAARSR